jgi:hypothetical protein
VRRPQPQYLLWGIKYWYPHPPKPGDAQGLLRPLDDCDEIQFSVEYNVAPADVLQFSLDGSASVTWWKAILIPLNGGGFRWVETENRVRGRVQITVSGVNTSRSIEFWKAKSLGVHDRIDYTWDVLPALIGGSRTSLVWVRDRC